MEKKYEPVKKVVAEQNFCCGFKRCPVVSVFEDGSALIIDGDQRIEFTPEQLTGLRALLVRAL